MAISRDSHVFIVFSCTNITQMSLKYAVVFHILRKGNENKYKDSLSKEKEYKQYVRVLSI